MSGARRFAPARIALVVCLLAVAATAALVAQRRSVAKALIDAQLRSLGLEEIGHEVERLGFTEFGVRNFYVGRDRNLEIDRIDARYSLSSLLAGKLESLDIRGVRIRGAVDEEGRVSLGALDQLIARDTSSPSASGPPPLLLPARNITIADVEVSLTAPEGPVTGRLEARFSESGGRVTADGSLEAENPAFAGTVEFELAGAPDDYTGEAEFELKARNVARETDRATQQEIRAECAECAVGGETHAADSQAAPFAAAAIAISAKLTGSRERVDVAIEPMPFRYRLDEDDAAFRAGGESPALTLSLPLPVGAGPLGISSAASGGRLRLPGLELEMAGLSFDVALDPSSLLPAGEVRVERLADTRTPARFAESTLTGAFTLTGAGVDFDLRMRAADDLFDLELRGTHDPAVAAGRVDARLAPLVFAEGGFQPLQVFPSLGASIGSVSGSIEARGSAEWSAEAPVRSRFDVIARGLSLTSELGSFERLDTAIRIEGPEPLHTPPAQLVSMAKLDFGLELTNGVIVLQWRGDRRLDIESAKFSLAGGEVHTHGRVDFDAPSQALVLEVRDVELAELLALAKLDGLTGGGRVSGTIPVVRRGSTLEIHGGKLAGAPEGGFIRYDAGGLGNAPGSGQGLGIAFETLENFQYDTIEATLDGDTAGPVEVSIRLRGRNPDYREGHPIDFTLNVESHLVDLLDNANAIYRIPDEIQQRIEALSGASD